MRNDRNRDRDDQPSKASAPLHVAQTGHHEILRRISEGSPELQTQLNQPRGTMIKGFGSRHVLAGSVLVLAAFSIAGCLSETESVQMADEEAQVEASSDDLISCSEVGQDCYDSQDCCGSMLCSWLLGVCIYS
jgi:hypothetical protein